MPTRERKRRRAPHLRDPATEVERRKRITAAWSPLILRLDPGMSDAAWIALITNTANQLEAIGGPVGCGDAVFLRSFLYPPYVMLSPQSVGNGEGSSRGA